MTSNPDAGRDQAISFDPLDPAVLQCPYPHYARLRDEAPVYWSDRVGAYLVTRHDLVSRIVRDTETFSSKYGRANMPVPPDQQARIDEVVGEGYPRVSTLLTQDPPAHNRYRRLVSKAFTPRRVASLEPYMRDLADRLIDTWIDCGRVEFVSSFAVPYPVEIIATVLNVPGPDRQAFKRWSDAVVSTIGADVTLEQRILSEQGVNDLERYFAAQIDDRATNPQDDMLTDMLNARIDIGDEDITDRRPLDKPEMLSMIRQIVVAGNETSTSTMTEAMLLLARHPEEWQRVKDDPSRIPLVVEETLRLLSPSQALWRLTTRDTELEGVAIEKGARLVINYSSADHDPAVFGDDAEEFRPDRDHLDEHLAFGKGVHFCLGAKLARLEIRVALEQLIARLAAIRVDDNASLRYMSSYALRGLESLDLQFERE